jgi:predicted nucleic acid-binding protein
MIYLLDTSAVLIHYRQEPGFERVLYLFDDPANEILLSSISLAEFGRVLRNAGMSADEVDTTLDAYLPLFCEIVPVDDLISRASLRLIAELANRIPLADSLIAASAQQRDACLVHRDGHFREIPATLLRTIDLAPPDKDPRTTVDLSVVR